MLKLLELSGTRSYTNIFFYMKEIKQYKRLNSYKSTSQQRVHLRANHVIPFDQ